EMLNRIVQLAQGHPFAAIELARSATTDAQHTLPASAAEAITARLCDVPASARALLHWMALSGDECDVGFVEALASQAQVPALSTLDDALAAGVLVLAGSRYRFRHELVRQALIGQLAPHHRMKMHRQIATELAERGAAPASVAQHWLEGAQPKQALPW